MSTCGESLYADAEKLDASFAEACNGGACEIAAISVYIIARPANDGDMNLGLMVEAVQEGRLPGIHMVIGDRARQTGQRMKHCEIFRAEVEDGVVATIKAFCNGSMHVTGAKSFRDSAAVVRRFAVAYTDITGISLRLEEIIPRMVNVNCKCGHEIDLRSFYQRWVAGTNYDPSQHHALKVHVGPVRGMTPPKPYAKKKAARVRKETQYIVKVLVFSTGGIMITGAKSPDDVRLAYDTVVNNMIPKVDVVVSSTVTTGKRRVQEDDAAGDASKGPTRRPRISANDVKQAEDTLPTLDMSVIYALLR